MAMQPAVFDTVDHKLSMRELIENLVADGRVEKRIADDFLIPIRSGRLEIHPLVIISQQEWADLARPGKKLTLEILIQWLADKSDLPYCRIDPLKVDVTSVTAVISSAYANRHKILPIAVTEQTVTIATAGQYRIRL